MSAQEHLRSLTSKGQVTLPKDIRERLRLRPGDMVRFVLDEEGRVIVSRAAPSLEEAYGSVPPLQRPEDFQRLRDDAVEDRVRRKFGRGEATR